MKASGELLLRLTCLLLAALLCGGCAVKGPQPSPSAAASTLPTRLVDLDPAKLVETVSLPVIPRPKSMQAGTGAPLRLTKESRIAVAAHAAPLVRQAAVELRDCIGERASMRLEIGEGEGAIVFAPSNDATLPAEGYILTADSHHATIAARDDRGFYNGAQTLKQLLNGPEVRPVKIRDWPTLGFRGIHWHGGRNSFALHERLLSRILGPLKINALVYETSYAQWTSQPAIWDKERSTPLVDLRKVVEMARARGIEPIPLVQALSHTGWLFRNGQNADLRGMGGASDYVYEVESDRTYETLFAVYAEALEIFHPRWVHIGHDEVSASTTQAIFLQDTRRIHDWLKSRNVGTMMWGDMLLVNGAETNDVGNAPTLDFARAIREALPKDIMIADWHYQGAQPDYPSVNVLSGAGFQVIGASWADARNIRDFSRALTASRAAGLLETTWAGYAVSPPYAEGSEFHQFAAYVTAAEQAWNGGAVDPLGYEPMTAFMALWQRDTQLQGGDPKTGGLHGTVHPQLHPAFGIALGAEQGFCTLGGAPTTLPAGVHAYGGNAFVCGPVITVRSPGLALDFGLRKADKVSLLWAASPLGGPPPELTLVYEDGTQGSRPGSIAAFDDPITIESRPLVWQGRLGNLGSGSLHRWDLFNPHPEWAIRTLVIRPNENTQIILAGVSGIHR